VGVAELGLHFKFETIARIARPEITKVQDALRKGSLGSPREKEGSSPMTSDEMNKILIPKPYEPKEVKPPKDLNPVLIPPASRDGK
jgi:hypothetical protein